MTPRLELCYVLYVEQIAVSSSWLVVNGNVCTIDGRRWNGRKKGPQKKRGKPTSDESRLDQLRKIAGARERRRAGFKTGTRDC